VKEPVAAVSMLMTNNLQIKVSQIVSGISEAETIAPSTGGVKDASWLPTMKGSIFCPKRFG
jgi:hypothetical protein